MPASLHDPRRAPRLSLRVAVDVAAGAHVWRAVTDDLGPQGCLVRTDRPLLPRAPVRLQVHAGGLTVGGVVAWRGRERVGICFTPYLPAEDPQTWYRHLLRDRPELRAEAVRFPDRLALELPLYFLPQPGAGPQLGPDELRLLSHFRSGLAVSELGARAGVAGERFARAVFSLLHKRVLTACRDDAVIAWLEEGRRRRQTGGAAPRWRGGEAPRPELAAPPSPTPAPLRARLAR